MSDQKTAVINETAALHETAALNQKKRSSEQHADQETVKLNPLIIGLGLLALLVGVVSGLIMSHATLVR